MNLAKPKMNAVLNTENLTNLIQENTCFKGTSSCIDLILTNSKYSFQHSSSIETGLGNHHHLVFSMIKTKLAFEEPIGLVCHNFKSFSNDYFEEELSSKLDHTVFENNFVNVFNKHAPKRQHFYG